MPNLQQRELRKKYKITELQNDADLMIYDVCRDGMLMAMNKNCRNVIGYNAKEMLGQKIWNFLIPETVEQHKISYQKHITNKIPYVRLRHNYIHKDGHILWMESSGIPLIENKECMGYKMISKDVTKEVHMEKKLEIREVHMEKKLEIREHELLQKNQELEHFTFSVSHDLKAPLVTLEGFSSIIQEDIGIIHDSCPFHASGVCEKKDKLKQLHESATEINKAVKELSINIESLLELSRIGRLHADRTKESPKKVIQYILKMNEKYVEQAQATIKINCTIPKMDVQKEVFSSILQNVISNSLRHAKKKQEELKINISIKKKRNNDALIIVTDNGKGVPKKEREKMFTVLSERGRGFGLTIIKKGIELHNGKIWAEENEGGGTKINMLFPNCI